MRQSSLIGHVIEVFTAFRRDPNVPADAVIRKFYFDRKYLGSKDRRFIADAYFGIIKNYQRLEAIVEDSFDDKEVTPARIVAAYSIAFLGLSPEEMQSVVAELETRVSKDDNPFPREAFWRMADRSREIQRLAAMDPVDRLSIAYSFPKWFVERLTREYGTDEVEAVLNSMNDEAPTVLRANTLVVANREELADELNDEGCETAFSHLAQNALVLPRRVNVMGLKSFRRGAFEIQDEASQLVVPFAKIAKTNLKVLDACAGAGGKTLHMAAMLRNRGEIFATDVDPWKLEELKKRVRRSGAQNVRVVKQDEKQRMLGPDKNEWFDVVLLDVPCTGTGTLRRNPSIKWVLTEQMLQEVQAKQRAILDENVHYLKPGGTLLYATCSVLKDEGEDQIREFLERHADFELEEMMRTRPDKQGCDGFFAARLKRKAGQQSLPS